MTSNALSVNFLEKFGTNPAIAPVVGGIPKFEATLADIMETTVLTGVPTVSSENNFEKDDGSILIDLTFVIVAQYFTPSDSGNLSLTITASPIP